MARWKCHFLHVCRVPRTEDDASIVWIVFELRDHLTKLVDPLSGVICEEMSNFVWPSALVMVNFHSIRFTFFRLVVNINIHDW